MKKVCVLGLGYIGLPTAAMFATSGLQVLGVDINARIVDTLNNGDIHIEEPGLKELVQEVLANGRLRVAREPEPADAFVIAVPTPLTSESASPPGEDEHDSGPASPGPQADLTYVIKAAEALVPHLRAGNLVILESTVLPRTTEDVLVPILRGSGLQIAGDKNAGAASGDRLFVAHCPERVLPCHILRELVQNDRIVGGVDATAAELARDLYGSFVKGQMFLTDATTAEMSKLMENTFRDVNIALANEFALVAQRVGIDVWEAIRLANRHPRVNILNPGPGVGGHCIAVDPWFIAQSAPDVTSLIQTARNVNDNMPARVAEIVKKTVADIEQPVIACLGLAYKADVDDVRESPALKVVRLLQAEGYEVRAFDPHVGRLFEISCQTNSLEEAVISADCLVVLTDHSAFHSLSPRKLAALMSSHIILDTRNFLTRDVWEDAGFSFLKAYAPQQTWEIDGISSSTTAHSAFPA